MISRNRIARVAVAGLGACLAGAVFVFPAWGQAPHPASTAPAPSRPVESSTVPAPDEPRSEPPARSGQDLVVPNLAASVLPPAPPVAAVSGGAVLAVPGPGPAPAAPTLEVAATQSERQRPRFSVGIGMGISRDSTGFVGGRTVAIPAFQVQLGVGDGLLGFEVSLFSNQAAGRYHEKSTTMTASGGLGPPDMAVDRQAFDVSFAFRPLAFRFRHPTRWLDRSLRTVTANLGFGAEEASIGPPSVVRLGPVVGLHVDLPLTPGNGPGDLRIRISARRMFAGESQVGTVVVSDTQQEVFGGLALAF